MTSDRGAFLAGERPSDVHVYLHEETVSNPEALLDHGERLEDGIALVMDGERARRVFSRVADIDPMELAGQAMGTDGEVDPDCVGGTCPAGTGESHRPRFVFAFAERQNPDAGGLYAEGNVLHAYVVCTCGETYSDKWLPEG